MRFGTGKAGKAQGGELEGSAVESCRVDVEVGWCGAS